MTGKIIVANYTDIMTHINKQGYFLVIYDEGHDFHTQGNSNIIALKITSQLDQCNVYSLPISHTKLEKQSLLQCSKIYTLDKKDVIVSIGGVNDNYMKRVINMMSNLYVEMNTQRERRQNAFQRNTSNVFESIFGNAR